MISEREAMREGVDVVKSLVRFQKSKMPKIPENDLTSYLNLKLIGLWEKYDPLKGTWRKYINGNLKYYILNWIRDSYRDVKVSRRYLDTYNKISKIRNDYPELQSLSPDEVQKFISQKLGMTDEDIQEAELAISFRFTDDISISENLTESPLDSNEYYYSLLDSLSAEDQDLLKTYHLSGGEGLSPPQLARAELITEELRQQS